MAGSDKDNPTEKKQTEALPPSEKSQLNPSFAVTGKKADANDTLKTLKELENTSTEEKIEIARLELEKGRLEIDKERSDSEKRFLNKHFAATLTATISLAAVLVTFAQIWIVTIQKDKELEIFQLQKKQELESVLNQQIHQRKLDMAKFVSEHGSQLLSKDKKQRELITNIMIVTFPPESSFEILSKLESTTDSPEIKKDFQRIRNTILPAIQAKSIGPYQTGKGLILKQSSKLPVFITPTLSPTPAILFNVHTHPSSNKGSSCGCTDPEAKCTASLTCPIGNAVCICSAVGCDSYCVNAE